MYRSQDRTHLGRKVAFLTMAPSICWSSVWNLFRTPSGAYNFEMTVNFWKICAPLILIPVIRPRPPSFTSFPFCYSVPFSHSMRKCYLMATSLCKLGMIYFCVWRCDPARATASSLSTITLRHTTVSKNPLDQRSDRRRDLYLTTNNTHKGQTSMSPAGFETAIPESEWPQTHALDRATTGIGSE